MATQRDIDDTVKVFENAYKYYKGWLFEYQYPGFFVYHQMGGDLSVYFTPDWNEKGRVDIQVTSVDGENIEVHNLPYEHPARNGVPYVQAEAYHLFRIVKPWLEKFSEW